MRERDRSRWGPQQRLEFIDYRLCWEGRINRLDLIDYFGVSAAQASLDLREYQRLAPANTVYETRSKSYLATPEFQPTFVRASEGYLGELLALRTGALAKEHTFIGSPPNLDSVGAPVRRVPPDIFSKIVRAIRNSILLEVAYERTQSSQLLITPHALFFDGIRWHVRVHYAADKTFGNLVLGRVTSAKLHARSQVDARADTDWSTYVELRMVPHPQLSSDERCSVELDFGMVAGVAAFTVRRALLRYTLSYLGIADVRGNALPAAHLMLLNPERIESALAEVSG